MDILKKAGEIEKAAEELMPIRDKAEEGGLIKDLADKTEKAADVMLNLKEGQEGKLDKLIHEVEDAAETLLDLDK